MSGSDDSGEEAKNLEKGKPNAVAKCCSCCCGESQSCCTKNHEWKCYQVLCAAIWAVIVATLLVGILFGSLSCTQFYKVSGSIIGNSYLIWIYMVVYIIVTFITAALFLIFTKWQCASGCCCIYGFLWLLVHLGFGIFTITSIYLVSVPKWKELNESYEKANGKIPKWLEYIQDDQFCCFNSTSGQVGVNQGIIKHCKEAFVNGSYSAHVLACISVIDEIYEDCLNFIFASSHILLVLGFIPFTVFCCVYQKFKKYNTLTPAEDEKSHEGDISEENVEEEGDDESGNQNDGSPPKDVDDENNNLEEHEDRMRQNGETNDDKNTSSGEN